MTQLTAITPNALVIDIAAAGGFSALQDAHLGQPVRLVVVEASQAVAGHGAVGVQAVADGRGDDTRRAAGTRAGDGLREAEQAVAGLLAASRLIGI